MFIIYCGGGFVDWYMCFFDFGGDGGDGGYCWFFGGFVFEIGFGFDCWGLCWFDDWCGCFFKIWM